MELDDLVRERMRLLRHKKKFNQEKVAQMLHMTQSAYSNYEVGRCKWPLDVLIRLAKLYDTSIDYLVGITDNPKPPPRN